MAFAVSMAAKALSKMATICFCCFTDLGKDRLTSFNDELEINENRKLLRIVDILGRETIPTNYTPLFYIYEDGSVERKIITN